MSILIFISLFCATLVYVSKNPIYSLMFLILTFLNAAFYVSRNVFIPPFISVSLVLIYIGAIAILFLFVLMLINLRLNKVNGGFLFDLLNFFPIATIFFIFSKKETNISEIESFNHLSDLTLFSSMFEPHLFFMIGLLLAAPLFTVIGITKSESTSLVKQQVSNEQIARSLRTVGLVA